MEKIISFLTQNSFDFSDDLLTRDKYSIDASLFKEMPSVIVFPKNATEISNLVKYIHDENIDVPITARGAGTCMSGGSLTSGVMLDLKKYMNKIIDVDSDSVTVEPGMYYKDLEKFTLENGWLMPSYPASRDLVTIGGMVANNSGGEKTYRYGKTIDYIDELTIVLSNGEICDLKECSIDEIIKYSHEDSLFGRVNKQIHELIIKNHEVIKNSKPNVTKNSAGYMIFDVYNKETNKFNIAKLIVGSQCTLGIITKIKMHGVAPKDKKIMLVSFLNDLSSAVSVVNILHKHNPETIESYDDHTFKIATKYFFEIATKMEGSILKLAIAFLPEVGLLLKSGIPKIVIMSEFAEDMQSTALVNARNAKKELDLLGITSRIAIEEFDRNKYWTLRRESFNLLRSRISGQRTVPLFEDVVFNVKDLDVALREVEAVLDEYDFIYTIAGHAGDANFHIIPLLKKGDKKTMKDMYTAGEKIFEIVKKYKGSLSGEHNDGLVRTPYLHMMYSTEMLAIFDQIKAIFDPKEILNPHKKTDCSLEYSKERLFLG